MDMTAYLTRIDRSCMYKKLDLNGKHAHGGGVGSSGVGMGKGKSHCIASYDFNSVLHCKRAWADNGVSTLKV